MYFRRKIEYHCHYLLDIYRLTEFRKLCYRELLWHFEDLIFFVEATPNRLHNRHSTIKLHCRMDALSDRVTELVLIRYLWRFDSYGY